MSRLSDDLAQKPRLMPRKGSLLQNCCEKFYQDNLSRIQNVSRGIEFYIELTNILTFNVCFCSPFPPSPGVVQMPSPPHGIKLNFMLSFV